METKYLQVATREEKKSKKTGGMYAVLSFITPNTKQVMINGQMQTIKQKPETVRGITGFEESNLPSLNGEPDYEWTLNELDYVVGARVTRPVQKYFIPDGPNVKKQGPEKEGKQYGRYATTASVVVLADTADEQTFEAAVQRAFANKNHVLIGAPAQQAIDANAPKVEVDEDDNEPQTTKGRAAAKAK